ncbi:hypothetical protein NQ317_017702 [Molorchus minor]|uniref:Uncharacterized protein n=1 Tax=Molorchus minor TaxID=1323400 RepID=A0ABQ9JPM7_9CUCU|nr:hypothetical protein NQ317_017702 [Molorchus minor]
MYIRIKITSSIIYEQESMVTGERAPRLDTRAGAESRCIIWLSELRRANSSFHTKIEIWWIMVSILSTFFLKKNGLTFNNTAISSVRWTHNPQEKVETTHKVNNLEKRFLVWTGKYKSVDEVPNSLSQSTIEKARSRIRIRIANFMMLATIIGCIAMVYSGKQAHKKGDSVQKQNLEWHKELKQETNK